MATNSKSKPRLPDADILTNIHYDRLGLRFSGTFTPCAYVYDEDGVTHKLNAAGEKEVLPIGDSFVLQPTLDKIMGMQLSALVEICKNFSVRAGLVLSDEEIQAMAYDMLLAGEHMDAAQTRAWESLKLEAEATWDRMIADYEADPTLPVPSVGVLAARISCLAIQQSADSPGPFIY